MPTPAPPGPLMQVCIYIYISFYLISCIKVNANAGTTGAINAGMYTYIYFFFFFIYLISCIEVNTNASTTINAGMYIYVLFYLFNFLYPSECWCYWHHERHQ